MNKHRSLLLDLLVIVFFLLFLPLFFYNLGGYSLADFDEGWYGAISNNILKNRQPILLTFNGAPFTDHPPFGFDLIALSFSIFGVNEFADRFPSALLGFASIIVIYLIGKKLFNRTVGIIAGLITLSCVWFIFRARSGNLDTIFLFFYVLTLYFFIKCKDKPYFLILFSLTFAILLMTKAFLGITILIPVIVFLFIQKTKINLKYIIISLLVFVLSLSPWMIIEYQTYGIKYFSNMVMLGLRSSSRIPLDLVKITSSNTYNYLHFGIGKWFYLVLISIFGSMFFLLKDKKIIPLYFLIFALFYGFLTNRKTEIWHLIPLYPFLALITAFFLYKISFLITKLINIKTSINLKPSLIIIPVLLLSFWQIYNFRGSIKLFDQDKSELSTVAKAASNYREKLYLDGHDLFPSSVFYSGKTNYFLRYQAPPVNNLKGLFQYGQRPFMVITEKWRLDTDKISYQKDDVIAERNNYILLRIKN